MANLGNLLEKLFKFMASLKLAVIVIIGIGVISAVGTIFEARYDAAYAQKLVYHSPYMYAILALLCINLINVMIDRLPWKRHHIGFILAHIGIITLLGGSLVTRIWGVDGSMSFDIGGENRYVTMPETEFSVYSTFGNNQFKPMDKRLVDLLLRPPKDHDYSFQLGPDKIKITDYYHYAQRDSQIVRSKDMAQPEAVRLQFQGSRINMTQWMARRRSRSSEILPLGPAQVVLSKGNYKWSGQNELIMVSKPEHIEYEIYSKRLNKRIKKGTAKPGDVIETGWMDISVRFLNHYHHAEERVTYTNVGRPGSKFVHPAMQMEFNGKRHWLSLNSMLRVFGKDVMYTVFFGNRRLDLGFPILLKKFTMNKYQGTERAATYSSDVWVEEIGEQHISMNNPMKHKGYTFYQASFSKDESGKPVASILSVNKDPGRWIKYLGSFLIVLGSVILFYFKRMQLKKKKRSTASSAA